MESPSDNSLNLDAAGLSEFIRFTFNRPVTLLEVVFDNTSTFGPENFDMAVDNVDVDVASLLGTDAINDLPNAGFGLAGLSLARRRLG